MLKQTVLLGVTLVGLGLGTPSQAWSQLSDADRKGIQEVTDKFVQAMRKNDSVTLAASYTEDAMLFPPNQPVVKGRAAIQHYLAQFPKIISFNATLSEVEGRGNLAYTRGTFEVTTAPATGQKTPGKNGGKFIEIRQKEPDGSWLVLRDFWNQDQPPGR